MNRPESALFCTFRFVRLQYREGGRFPLKKLKDRSKNDRVGKRIDSNGGICWDKRLELRSK